MFPIIGFMAIKWRNILIRYIQIIYLILFVVSDLVQAKPGGGSSRIMQSEICNTEECKYIAEEILRNLKSDSNPCDNFYEYACGNYKQRFEQSQQQEYINQFNILQNTINERLEDIISQNIVARDSESLKKAKQAYKACVDERAIEEVGVKDVAKILKQNGGWPMAMSSWQRSLSWQEIDENYIRILGGPTFFRIGILSGYLESNIHHFVIQPIETFLPSEILKKLQGEKKVKQYINFVVAVATEFVRNDNVSIGDMKRDVDDMIALEYKLNKIISNKFKSSDVIKSSKEFQSIWDSKRHKSSKTEINWMNVIHTIFTDSGINMGPSDRFFIYDKHYFYGLANVLKSTSTRVLVNYVHWKFVCRVLMFTNSYMRELYETIQQQFLRRQSSRTRSLDCVYRNPALSAVMSEYIKKYVPDQSIKIATKMVTDLKNQIHLHISSTPWLDEKDVSALLMKVTTMHTFVGYLPFYKNTSSVDEYFQNLKIGSNHFQNELQSKIFSIRKSLQKLNKPVNKFPESKIMPKGIVDINAYYLRDINVIVIPSGMLHQPILFNDVPEVIQFSKLGAIVGHELSHGYDEEGRKYAHNGSHTEWSEKSIEAFTERAKCFVNQFNSYKYEELEVLNNREVYANGKQTEKENMADTVGAQLSFAAYRDRPNERHLSRLPGLDAYTDNQLYFLSFANVWCEVMPLKYLVYWAKLNAIHSVAKHRVIGTLSNMKEFATAFKCPKNSVMNPKKRCALWA